MRCMLSLTGTTRDPLSPMNMRVVHLEAVPPDIKMTMTTPLPARNVLMKNANNKKQLIGLLCSAHNDDDVNVKVIGQEDEEFGHEEADINIISYTLRLATEESREHIQVLSEDTDVFVLLVYFCWKCHLSQEVTMRKFDGTVIDITATARKLGNKSLQLLPLHVITGCDTVSYPFGKGKVSAINVMMKHDNLDLTPVGQPNTSEEVLMETGRRLFCLLYGVKICTTMAEVCHMLFTTKREKCSNLHSLPPTDEALTHHMKRAHLQAMLWKAADEQQPPDVSAGRLWVA